MAAPRKPAPFDVSQLVLDVHLVTDPFGIYKPTEHKVEDDHYQDMIKQMKKMMVSARVESGEGSDTGDSAFEDYEGESEDESYDEESDYDLYDPWLKVYYATIKTKDGRQIGKIGYRVVNASARAIGEYDDLNLVWKLYESSRSGKSLKEFVRSLYDKETGRVCEEYLKGGSRTGKGVFNEELNDGSFAYLSDDKKLFKDDFSIDPEFQGRGIGSWVLQELFKHRSFENVDFVFAYPRATDATRVEEENTTVKARHMRIHRFFRKSGFRRVGQSPYFGYALQDSKHPSHSLPMNEDTEFKAQSCPRHLNV